MSEFVFCLAQQGDAESLADLRATAMRESLEALGRYDLKRARERFLDGFVPAETAKLVHGSQTLGFFVLQNMPDHLWLNHLYIHPSFQGAGIGAKVLEQVKAVAKKKSKPVRLGALKRSKANAFYQGHGFLKAHEDEFDIYYELPLTNIEAGPAEFLLMQAETGNAERLADLRHEAMKDEWAANGLTNYPLARSHFFEDFKPEVTLKIMSEGELLGFYAFHEYAEYFHIDMLFLHPKAQGRGIGSKVLAHLKATATQARKPIRLGALRISRSNDFYRAHGFNLTHYVDLTNYYEYRPNLCLQKPETFRVEASTIEDFNLLAEIRQQAMQENLEANGLFDHALYTSYFKQSFDPACTHKVMVNAEMLGFYVLWNKQDHLDLERIYFLPNAQGRGIGKGVLDLIKQQASEQNKPIRLEVLPKSRANAFYLRNGFGLIEKREEEYLYEWTPQDCSYVISSFRVEPVNKADFNMLADIRFEAMKAEWAANGMFDHAVYRRKFESTFDPAFTQRIVWGGETVGFYVMWVRESYLYLERFYIHPKMQNRGIGGDVLGSLKQQAREQGKPIKLETFPRSRVNAFYLRNGFKLTSASQDEKNYEFLPEELRAPA
ncbi:tRNA(Met) cytidine acetyltransferase TmcA [Pseudovibrio axinellae]|uniref:tRNA(Met) cytidine acetyltransferase TmcA n=1 Tax=Pseudovibrio axinellae TaxID=989403 RepID=A0A165YK53_9HYPH|nr:GNAT family N-acetyltransferase [Pseudovibrio axinellae]KZL18912.1 tRNA(Met) cytidine acetyltransferase TmcA [Pseudovibrio axinellae]SEP87995.1 Ribosomal protein S18 acetylase RimI [Pseudovibrio axinellae]